MEEELFQCQCCKKVVEKSSETIENTENSGS